MDLLKMQLVLEPVQVLPVRTPLDGVFAVLVVEPYTIPKIIQQICCFLVFNREFCHNPVGASGDGLPALPACGKLAHIGGCKSKTLPQ
ncbi:MAG: hypothetical protein ACKPKO_04375 [Candidatus Fonsibacter sp.]